MFNIVHFLGDETGATSIEYGLIAALVALAGIIAFTATGDTITDSFDNIARDMCEAVGGSYSLTSAGTDSCTFS
ncbi:Flp family type IVb pilin [Sneathiella glossodoripedis]|uniref:Flp family type IVb pilin n=1 Tax=Sneathiella glossodoripedis TaxID=418853 RepID=UPI000567541B|nr:Flp family type IVb pilin [Sneathiella glossodoripedis]